MMGKYRSKGKPYANMELKGGGGGGKKKFGGSATLQAKKGRTKIKLGVGGGWTKNRPIQSVDIKEGSLSKGIDLTVPIGPADFSIGASESRDKFQADTPWGIFKDKGKPVRNFRAGVNFPVGQGTFGITGDVTPRGPNRKRKVGARLGFTSNFNKGGKVSKKNKKK
tara:strand:- start:1017 stop:1514 length:498 start_codon:yes stop_codon:yes gene_type:complete